MPRYVTPSAEDGRRLINDFIDETFGDLSANLDFVATLRTAVPEMPADPSPEQLGAWAELSKLVRDADFKARVAGWPSTRRPRGRPGTGPACITR
ncbi:hypothetical protein AB0C10_27590 [Microbispora amethystogenes]|uniref:hypothetical protein n=1 Tax=Microbispora amethystogenes TaxID=1427754 RepID=UPI0033E23FFB